MSRAAPSYADFRVGDRVHCLAWIGQPFDVVRKDDDRRTIVIQSPPGSLPGQIEIHPRTRFLLTREHWDQVWYWPDRAGEHYHEVFDRFVGRHRVGQVVAGYHLGEGLAAVVARMRLVPDADAAMTFRIKVLGGKWGEVRVHPVAAVHPDGNGLCTARDERIPDEAWLRCGPTVPLRMGMRRYRWCLSFGELVLNWEDLSAPDVIDSPDGD